MVNLTTHSTMDTVSFDAAQVDDCKAIADLFRIAADGVADYFWSTMLPDYPGLTPLEIGAKRYAREDIPFSYRNCVLARRGGEILGMMMTFPIPPEPDEPAPNRTSAPSSATPESVEPDVMAPYSLEAPNTWYICALAVYPAFRKQGLGSHFLELARQQAKEKGFQQLSLLCFEQNVNAFQMYQRRGFSEVARTAVVPHQLIHYTGDIVLMAAPV